MHSHDISEFMRLAPRIFLGSGRAHDAEAWMERVEKAFRAMNCKDDEEKVRYATYMLEDNALDWWEGIERENASKPELFKWQDFCNAFYSRYFPPSMRHNLVREFMKLKQDGRSVEEYETEFDRLAWFAPTLIVDKTTKMIWFKEELESYIQISLASVKSTIHDELVDKTKNVELVSRNNKDSEIRDQKMKSKDGSASRGQSSQGSMRFQPYERPHNSSGSCGSQWRQPSQGMQSKATSRHRPTSVVCGKFHRTDLCRHATGACLRCGEQGKKIGQCPMRSQSLGRYKGPRFLEPCQSLR
ncbi:uncharacterized protein LOC143855851 [Tasmannia lanceolata]|uniref:uncharacterized protein LOC143855851 n=1 Tax=Tasmannia lanceolata TaxID=3420 RepID=UPI00406495AB